METRYQIYNGSQSGHCCFEATVIDKTKPEIINGKHWKDDSGQYHYANICECFSLEDAEMICQALNNMDKKQ